MEFTKGHYARVQTWFDNILLCKIIGRLDQSNKNAQLEDYLILLDNQGGIVLLIPYKCSWSYPLGADESARYGIDPQYQGQQIYLCPPDWIVEVRTVALAAPSRSAPDGAQCHCCKYFVHMAAPNGTDLGLPESFFVCRNCRHNDSLMYLLRASLTSTP